MSLVSRLQRRYIIEGDQLAHDAETCIGELMAALRKIQDYANPPMFDPGMNDILKIASDALAKCAEG